MVLCHRIEKTMARMGTHMFVLLEWRKQPLMMPRRLWEDPDLAACCGPAG